jgi:type II secretory pathway component PulF
MSQNPLAPVIAYHDQLKRLSAAGVALDLGLEKNDAPSKHRDVLKAIQRAEVALQLRVGLGQPLTDAVFAARELTPKYRASLLSWIETADIPTAFDPLTKSARDFVRVRRQLEINFIHPLIILTLVWLAFIVLCSTMVPRLVTIYQQMWKQPTALLHWLITIQHWMPVWIVLFPILLLVLVAYLYWKSRRSNGLRLSGTKRYLETLHLAQFADQLAMGLEEGREQSEVISQAEASLTKSIRTTSDTAPLMNWVLTGDLGNEPKSKILRKIAACYRQLAMERMSRWQSVFPAFLMLVIGGSAVFAYGFSLFLPLIDLLNTLTLPGGL